MNLADFLYEECIQCGADVSDKNSVLKAIATLAKNSPLLRQVNEDTIFQGLKEREDLGSTGFGDGIAIPHCTLDNIPDFVLGILTIPEGIDFDAIDGQKVKLLMFIIGPQEKRNDHIRVLSNLSSVLRFPENVREILAAKDPAVIRESFLRQTKVEKELPKTKQAYQQFTVIVQHEELFEDILSVFTELDGCSIAVLEANNAGQYLYALPLFSNFWSEEQKGFNRIILAVVSKALANETVRKINMLTEGLDEEESGVLLYLQDIVYLNGSLNL